MKIKKDWLLPSITTTKGADWRKTVKGISALGIKKVAVFPTCLSYEERQKLYGLLEKTGPGQIPFVHLRSDMRPEEIEYFIKRWQTKVFNIHPQAEYPLQYDYGKYRQMIYIENVYDVFDEKELESFAGICFDLSHLENDRHFHRERYSSALSMTKKFKIGCNHISAIRAEASRNYLDSKEVRYDRHFYKDLSEFDYVFKYPKEYFSKYIALELENSLSEQLKVADYLCGR